MTVPTAWLSAFPLREARHAVEALQQGWATLAAVSRPHFNPKTKEPALTKTLKVYVENVVARERGLLGMWSAEDIIGEVDETTGKLTEERRTDIVYGWNNNLQNMHLVFEFKRLGRQKKHREHYLRDQGLGRFVTGIYSRRQSVAAMVGVLLDPEDEVVPPIRKALEDEGPGKVLKLMSTPTGASYARPSALFDSADFDTEHERAPALASSWGAIRVSHFFLSFGYPTSTLKPKKAKSAVPQSKQPNEGTQSKPPSGAP